MKILIIFFILMYQNANVASESIAQLMRGTVTNIAWNVSTFLTHLRHRFQDLFIKVSSESVYPSAIRAISDSLNAFDKQKIRIENEKIGEYIQKNLNEEDSKDDKEYNQFNVESTAHMTTEQLIESHGKQVEIHKIQSEDGYILIMHRIREPVKKTLNLVNRTVLLHHGLLGSSADWILLGPEKSLPYILCHAGYDVWLTNARGNRYSRLHRSLTEESNQFWNFTWQEMGKYDLRAVIDYVWQNKEDKEQIDYIGHSMGTTTLLVLLSTFPDYNKYLRMGILLAPLAFMSEVKGPLKILASIKVTSDVVREVLGKGEFFKHKKIPSMIVAKFCKGYKIFCSNPLFFTTGSPLRIPIHDRGFLARLLYHVPAGGSTNTILHYTQLVNTGRFHAFNHVEQEFSMKNVTVPLALFSSSDDWLSTIPDVMKLYLNIMNPIEHVILTDKNMSHTEFVWGYESDILVFRKVIANYVVVSVLVIVSLPPLVASLLPNMFLLEDFLFNCTGSFREM